MARDAAGSRAPWSSWGTTGATGALGHVLKMNAGEDLVPAVRAALHGERYVCVAPDVGRSWNAS